MTKETFKCQRFGNQHAPWSSPASVEKWTILLGCVMTVIKENSLLLVQCMQNKQIRVTQNQKPEEWTADVTIGLGLRSSKTHHKAEINSALEIYNRAMKDVSVGLNDIETYTDGDLVDTKEQHKRLRPASEWARVQNLKLNCYECKVGLEESKYPGHILSENGLKLDDSRKMKKKLNKISVVTVV